MKLTKGQKEILQTIENAGGSIRASHLPWRGLLSEASLEKLGYISRGPFPKNWRMVNITASGRKALKEQA